MKNMSDAHIHTPSIVVRSLVRPLDFLASKIIGTTRFKPINKANITK
jgi:hypothetical protein